MSWLFYWDDHVLQNCFELSVSLKPQCDLNSTWIIFRDATKHCESLSMSLWSPDLSKMHEQMMDHNASIFWAGFTRFNSSYFYEKSSHDYLNCQTGFWKSQENKEPGISWRTIEYQYLYVCIGPLSPDRGNVKICNKLQWLAMGWKTDCNSHAKSIYWISSYKQIWIGDFWLSLLQVLSFNKWYSLKS